MKGSAILYYLAVIGVGASLFMFNKDHKSSVILFYGFAENKETEVNFNHPIQIKKIYVSPGQAIKKDQPLIDVIRLEDDLKLEDEIYKIQLVNEERNIWSKKINEEINILEEEKSLELSKIKNEIKETQTASSTEQNLLNSLSTVSVPANASNRHTEKVKLLETEYKNLTALFDKKIQAKKSELLNGEKEFNVRVNRLEYMIQHRENNQVIDISMLAPEDGLIGNINCKEAEHFSSYKTILSIYEPNPSIIKGYIQEDFIMQIAINDSIIVKSTKQSGLDYKGKVIGLGSRIVEIPARLRKRQEVKTFGREVIISIPKDNEFLQKEKTILELIPNKKESTNTHKISMK